MSERDDSQLNYLVTKFDEHAKHVNEELSIIKRGVYGESANKVPGLMDRQTSTETKVAALEKVKDKLVWISVGIGMTVQVIALIIIEIFRK